MDGMLEYSYCMGGCEDTSCKKNFANLPIGRAVPVSTLRGTNYCPLTETLASKVYKELTNDKECGIFAPFSENLTSEENQKKLSELKAEIEALELSYHQFPSCWVDNSKASEDESLLVVGLSKEDTIKLGAKYHISTVAFKDSEACEEICVTPFRRFVAGDVVQTYYRKWNKLIQTESKREPEKE